MRQYFQGTLDYACGIYAVINALSCIHSIGLKEAREILREANSSISLLPRLWHDFTTNRTDHYWVVRRTLSRWCCSAPLKCRIEQPFGNNMMPGPEHLDLENTLPFLPESEDPSGPEGIGASEKEVNLTWNSLCDWFSIHTEIDKRKPRRVAVFRFHRFIPAYAAPIVSHWTTAYYLNEDTLLLNDASPEKEALHSISRSDISPGMFNRAKLRIVPESIIYLEAVR